MATEKNFEFRLGDTWEIAAEFNDAEGEDLDIQGAAITLTVARAGVFFAALTNEDALTIEDGEEGTATLKIGPDDQDGWEAGTYTYDISVLPLSGDPTLQAFGRLVILSGPPVAPES